MKLTFTSIILFPFLLTLHSTGYKLSRRDAEMGIADISTRYSPNVLMNHFSTISRRGEAEVVPVAINVLLALSARQDYRLQSFGFILEDVEFT